MNRYGNGPNTFSAKWPWQTVPRSYVTNCPTEPWAGYYSGTIVENIEILDLFTMGDHEIN